MPQSNPPSGRRAAYLRLGGSAILIGLVLLIFTGTWAVPFTRRGNVLIGAWSGDTFVLEVTDNGGRFYAGCAEGFLTEPLRIDATGDFSLTATIKQINPVPTLITPVPAPPGSDRVSLRGHVGGASMELRIINQVPSAERDYNLTFQALYTPPTRCP